QSGRDEKKARGCNGKKGAGVQRECDGRAKDGIIDGRVKGGPLGRVMILGRNRTSNRRPNLSAAIQSLARHLFGWLPVEVNRPKRGHELSDERESCWVP